MASRLAAIVQSSQDAIIGKTLAGVITSWNAGAQQMYGYAADEMIGHNIAELIPDDRADELAPILERVTLGESVQHFETQRVAKDGTILDMSVAISPIRDEAGAVSGASTVARDLTEITRAKVHRQALEAQLHRAQRLESLGQLAGGVANDFNDLLAVIMNYSGLISATLEEELSRLGLSNDESMVAILGDVEQITAVAERGAELTRRLLIFSRREAVTPTQGGLGAELTLREHEVLELMAGGLINKQVARHLGLRLNTVRNHSQNILHKLRAHSRLEAVAIAVRDGVISYPDQPATN